MVAPEHARILIGIDLDGTIEDSRSDMVAAVQRVRAGFGLPARAYDVVVPHVNGGMDPLYRACFDDYRRDDEPAQRLGAIREAYEADYLEHVAVETQLYPGVRDALAGLAPLGALACVTNKPERISRRLLAALGVGGLFTTVVGGDSCPHIKPHPVMLETAALRCSFDRESGLAFMIGDTDGDIQLARSFGAQAIWCGWGYVSAPRETPDARATHPRELIAHVSARVARHG
ncbi:MAG: HAD hydrolase-like protein [Polyangiales bacterium]